MPETRLLCVACTQLPTTSECQWPATVNHGHIRRPRHQW